MTKLVSPIILLIIFLTTQTIAFGQKSGIYSSDNGFSCQIVKIDANNFRLIAGGADNVYERISGNIFKNSEPKYSNYRMKVESETKVYSYKEGEQGVYYSFNRAAEAPTNTEKCALVKKYESKVIEDPENSIWAFCGIAANMKCNMEEGSFQNRQLGALVPSMKAIYNSSRCPCSDAIPQSIWDAN